jgi:hypothetical protein
LWPLSPDSPPPPPIKKTPPLQPDWQITRKIVEAKLPPDEKALFDAKANEKDGYVEFYEFTPV